MRIKFIKICLKRGMLLMFGINENGVKVPKERDKILHPYRTCPISEHHFSTGIAALTGLLFLINNLQLITTK